MHPFLMKISLRSYLVLFLLLGLVLTIFFNKHSSPALFYPNHHPIIEHTLKGVKAKRFDREGNLLQELHMASWIHYQHDGVTHFISPNLTIYYPHGETWQIWAQKGKSFQQQLHGKLEKLHLSEDVCVLRLNPSDDSWYELKTQNMLFYPQQSIVSTTDPVVVNGTGMKVHAIGMHANLKNHAIDLLKDVKSVYAAR